jgi:hypothetical protein
MALALPPKTDKRTNGKTPKRWVYLFDEIDTVQKLVGS